MSVLRDLRRRVTSTITPQNNDIIGQKSINNLAAGAAWILAHIFAVDVKSPNFRF